MEARFGRCAYFLVVDPDTLGFEAIPNPNITQGGGAGIQSAQLMASKGVSVILTGNCGPNAFRTFNAAGIQVITGVSGHVALRTWTRLSRVTVPLEGRLKFCFKVVIPVRCSMGVPAARATLRFGRLLRQGTTDEKRRS